MKFDLKATASEKIIIVAHRGASGGNLPCNTLPAYETAIRHGADMVEIDVNKSADDTLFIFHPKMEKRHLSFDGDITKMSDQEISKLRYTNIDRTPTEHGLCTLDEALKLMRGRCYINIDKFWDYPIEISKALRRHDMMDQVVIKTSPKKEMLAIVEEYAYEIPYLPIINAVDNGVHEYIKSLNINYVGAELVFAKDSDEVAQDSYIEMLHKDGKLVWANSILYNYKVPLAGGHSDDISLSDDPDKGWGWIVDKGFDIIQTDWPLAVSLYLEQTGKRYKKN